MIIGTNDSLTRNLITVPELVAVLKTAAKIPTCVQYKGTLLGSKGFVYCDIHFYRLSTIGCKAWTEGGGPVTYAPRRFKGWKEVTDFVTGMLSLYNRSQVIGEDHGSIINTVYYPGGDTPLTPPQLASEAGQTFRASDYPERITGKMCDCGNGGEFELLPKDHPDVMDGGKRYMVCRICNGCSHI